MKISVITVAYNSAATIADTLDSVAAQTHADVEHIVVDGGSGDNTLDIVRQRGQHVARVVSEPDRGIYDAMNKGIALATGDAVGFINSDDFYASTDVLSQVVTSMADPAVDGCYGDLCYVQQAQVDMIVRYWRSSAHRPGQFGCGWVPPHPTLFLRRSLFASFGAFDLSYPIAADFELMARLLEVHRIKTVYLPQVLVKRQNRVGLALHALQQSALHHHRFRDFGHQLQQWRAGQRGSRRRVYQGLVAGQQLRPEAGLEGQRRNWAAVGAHYFGIVAAHYVQHHLVVLGIGLMIVAGPVGRTQVDFHRPVPFHVAQA